MSRMSEHHRAKCGVEGKCSRPMYQMGMEVFCDEPAWGEQYEEGSRYAPIWWSPRDRSGYYLRPEMARPYVPSLACKGHGGPGPDDVRFIRDGNMWCAFLPGFENLQESDAGFGATQREAEADLKSKEPKP